MTGPTSDKRVWKRFIAHGTVVKVWLNDQACIEGTVLDNSYGGIAITMRDEHPDLQQGSIVKIEQNNGLLAATIVNVGEPADGTIRVGMSWNDPGTYRVDGMWVAPDF